MKKIIDLAQIEAREKKLEDELAELRALKRYATKFGADYGQSSNGESALEPSEATVASMLRSIIGGFNAEEFNYQKIEQAVNKTPHKISRSSIFEFLVKLKEDGEIHTVRPGAGRRPAQWQTTEKFLPI